MDAKSRDLALLTALSLSCAGVALISDYLVLASVFFRHGDVFHQGADDSQYDVCPTGRGNRARRNLSCPQLPEDGTGQDHRGHRPVK